MADCSAPGCAKEARAKGLCTTHYQADRRDIPPERKRLQGETATLAPLTVPADWPERIAKAAKRDGCTVAEWVRRAIAAKL